MGVKDLWTLLSVSGRQVSLETLQGKTLAIDMSIWLIQVVHLRYTYALFSQNITHFYIHQFIKAMRSEDGQVMKNAHLIGTLRRILKLLFHRVKPLFVFDGETPTLKYRTVQNRRKLRSRQEDNYLKAAQKILASRVKQAVLTAQLSSEGKQINSISSKEDPRSTATVDGRRSVSSSSWVIDHNENCEEIDWEDGYFGLKVAKDDDDESDGDSLVWDLPEDSEEINIDVLSHLPCDVRKSIVEDARRKERQKKRSFYMPVAQNPSLYSQTQLANFLRTR